MTFTPIPLYLESNVATSLDRSTPLAERLGIGFQTMFLGLATVFAVLILLWGILALFNLFFHVIPDKVKNKKAAPAAEAPAKTSASPSPAAPADQGAIVAAITAAVSVMIDRSASSFRVVSFKHYDKH